MNMSTKLRGHGIRIIGFVIFMLLHYLEYGTQFTVNAVQIARIFKLSFYG